MIEWINEILPNVVNKVPELIKSLNQTLYLLGISGSISFVFGSILGIILTVTKKGNIYENKFIYIILDKIINIFRSIPFIILLASLIPLTRAIVGTAIGTKGAILPLIFGTVPFFSRQIESALAELDSGLIEAAQAMGTSSMGIIFRVYLKESIPGIVRATTITFVSLIGLTAMAGAIGGGGLGDFAIRYGHQRNQIDVTYVTVIILLIIVMIVQSLGNIIIKKTTH
ncbi:MAG: ABC-type metal ion transport system, permease component [Clostridiales bacterium]|nr:ABC-type metal ion transport system, permease component [Clostridiales bacterium]